MHSGWKIFFWVRSVFCVLGHLFDLSGFVDLLTPTRSVKRSSGLGFPLICNGDVFLAWGRDKRLLYAMFATTMLGMITMSGILTAEILILGQQQGRLSWPYGDFVPGNYLAKVGLPAFSVLVTTMFPSIKN